MNDSKTTTMKGRKILVCTTFREFNGNSNDEMQRMFLANLKTQTYQNYLLVATVFGEKNVQTVLDKSNVPYVMFNGDAYEYRFSLTQVLENAISLVDKPESYIIIFTCSDDLWENDLFEKVVNEMTPLSCCTSLPHISYKSIDDFKIKKIGGYIWGGVDLICFDGDIFLNPEARAAIRDYPNHGRGMTEYIFSSVAKVFSKRMFNMWPLKIHRIDNDVDISSKTREYFAFCNAHNKQTFDAFVRKYNLKGDAYTSILYYKTPMRHFGIRCTLFLMMNVYRIQNMFYSSWIFKSIPRGTKKFLKRMLYK
jgi:hypothetical protein